MPKHRALATCLVVLFVAISAKAQQSDKSSTLVVELHKVERGPRPESIQRQIDSLGDQIERSSVEKQERLKTRLQDLESRADKKRSVLLLGRYTIGAKSSRHDYPVEIHLSPKFVDRFAPGDFVQFRNPTRGQGHRVTKAFSDSQRSWLNPPAIKKIDRPIWWPDAPGYDAEYFTHDTELSAEVKLVVTEVAGIVHYPARGHLGIYVYSFLLKNTGQRRIEHARISIALLDESGDFVAEKRHRDIGAGVTSLYLTNLGPGEHTTVDIAIGPNHHQAFGRAEVWVRSVQFVK